MLGMNAVALVFFGCINVASVKQLLPQSGWTMALPVYYIALTTFVLLKIRGFFRKNQKQYRKFSTKSNKRYGRRPYLLCFPYYCLAVAGRKWRDTLLAWVVNDLRAGPCSTMTPPFHEDHLIGTSRAKAISWVTMIMVVAAGQGRE